MSFSSSSQTTYEFDVATAVQNVDMPAGDGSITYAAQVPVGWDIMGNTNGGFLMALIGHALALASGRPDCITITGHFLAPCPAGEVRIIVTPVRSGRRFATVTARLILLLESDHSGRGREKEVLRVLATMGDLVSERGGPTSMTQSMPTIKPLEQCVEMSVSTMNNTSNIHGRLAARVHAEDILFHRNQKSGQALIRGWFAFRDQRPIDTRALLLASDAFPPSVFNLDVGVGWVPTIELTIHIRAIPVPGPVACFFQTRFLQNGLLEEDGEIWDSAGVLVAQSRQLALAPKN